jgi:L-methionine (R)-S-oxide reductase
MLVYNLKELEASAVAIIEDEPNLIANLSNLAALIFHGHPGLNWAGFYLWSDKDQELVLGPFQGKPACIRIKAGRGVCGKAYSSQQVQRINDVFSFHDHIACDADTKSELVVPLIADGVCFGVLDLDAPSLNFFSAQDEMFFKLLIEKLMLQLKNYF